MDVRFSNRGTTLVASLAGELDHHYAGYVREKIEREIVKATTRNVVFDLSGLTFMDSSGIGVIAGRYAHVRKYGGHSVIICNNRKIRRILEISGISRLMPVFDELERALEALSGA